MRIMRTACLFICFCIAIGVADELTVAPDVLLMEYVIAKQWDSEDINHDPIRVDLSWKEGDNFLIAEFFGPFFNDPPGPDGPPGKPFPHLWDYEVAEVFFLGSNHQYLEVEVCPHGQHLLLLLNGTRNMIKDELPMTFASLVHNNSKSWYGRAEIPLSYLPHGISMFNAYAIHGSGEHRMYESLYPVPKGKYDSPDFHRLEYFRPIAIDEIVGDMSSIGKYWDNL